MKIVLYAVIGCVAAFIAGAVIVGFLIERYIQ